MENTAEKIFAALKEDISTYAGLKLRLLKLIAMERGAKIIALLAHGVILILLVFFTILFLFFALGFYFSQLLDNLALGFLIVGVIYLIMTLVMIWAKDRIRLKLVNLAIAALEKDDKDDDEDSKNQSTDTTRATDSRETAHQATMPGS